MQIAGARDLPARERAAWDAWVRATVGELHRSGALETGERALAACPELAAAPLAAVLRECWRLFAPGRRRPDLRLSLGERERLEVAARQLSRSPYGTLTGPAAAAAAAIDVAAEDWLVYWRAWTKAGRPPTSAPATLGGVSWCLRRLARRHARGARVRRQASRSRPGPAHA